ncbi:Zinc finger protein CONSTANS-LIKE 5 [Linum grandiflorum]
MGTRCAAVVAIETPLRLRCRFGNGRRTHHMKRASGAVSVTMCEVSEQALAAVTCKANAATLCVACNLDIHSANTVARRHEQVPIASFADGNRAYFAFDGGEEEVDGISWTFLGSGFSQFDQKQEGQQRKDQFFGEMEELLEFEYEDLLEGRFQPGYNYGGSDGIVPMQSKPILVPPPLVWKKRRKEVGATAVAYVGGRKVDVLSWRKEEEADDVSSEKGGAAVKFRGRKGSGEATNDH